MLAGAGFAEVALAGMRNPPSRRRALLAGAVMGALADVDIILGMLTGKGWTLHGTATHSIAAVVVWAAIGMAVGGWRWGVVLGAGYSSHLLLDLLDDSGPTNLMLGWPFTGQHPYSLGKLFPKVPIDGDGLVETVMNILTPGPGLLFLQQTALAAAFAALLFLLARFIRRARARRRS